MLYAVKQFLPDTVSWKCDHFKCFVDPTSRGKAVCKSKKLAYQRAVENAFSKVIIIVLSNGKVTVEVDTTRPELLLTEKILDDENVLKVFFD